MIASLNKDAWLTADENRTAIPWPISLLYRWNFKMLAKQSSKPKLFFHKNIETIIRTLETSRSLTLGVVVLADPFRGTPKGSGSEMEAGQIWCARGSNTGQSKRVKS